MVDVRLHLTHERRIEHIAQDDIAFALVLLHRTAPLRAPRRRHRQQRRKLSHEHILSITLIGEGLVNGPFFLVPE